MLADKHEKPYFFSNSFLKNRSLRVYLSQTHPLIISEKKKEAREQRRTKKITFHKKNRRMKRDHSGITDAIIPSIAAATIYISIGPYLTQYYFYILIALLVVVIIGVELWTHHNKSLHDDVVAIRKRSYQLRQHWRREERRLRSQSLTPSMEALTTRKEKRYDGNGIKNTFKRRAKSFREKYFHKHSSLLDM